MRASSAAVLGRPTPMKTLRAARSRRAATIVCSSPFDAASDSEDMLVHPGGEGVTVARDRVPRDIEVVVARRDVEAVGRLRPARGDGDRVDHPTGDDDAPRTWL